MFNEKNNHKKPQTLFLIFKIIQTVNLLIIDLVHSYIMPYNIHKT